LMIPTIDANKASFEGQTFSETVPIYQQEGQKSVYYFPIRYLMRSDTSPLGSLNRPLPRILIESHEMGVALYDTVHSGQISLSPLFQDTSEVNVDSLLESEGSSVKTGENRYLWMMKSLYSHQGGNRQLIGIIASRINVNRLVPPSLLEKGQFIEVMNSPSVSYSNKELSVQFGEPLKKLPAGELSSFLQQSYRYDSRFQLKDLQFPFTVWVQHQSMIGSMIFIGIIACGGIALMVVMGGVFYSVYGHAQKVTKDQSEASSVITRQQQEIQEGEKRFKHLIESTNVIPWAADLHTKSFTYIGPQIDSITGYTGATWLTPGYWVHHVHPNDRQHVLYHFNEFQEGKIAVREYRVRKSDGTAIWIRNSFACADPLTKGNPLPPRLVHGFMVDITEQKLAQEQLVRARDQQQEANKTKSEFLANMSHELRTPLNAIIGFAEIMKGEIFGKLGNSKYSDYVNSIYTSGRHLLDLINDILDLSKIEAGRFELQEEEIDLGDLLKSCYSLLAERARNEGQDFIFQLPDHIPVIYADSRRLKQILINLLTNAIKFTKMGGSVRLVLKSSPKNGLYIAVSDTGIGIKPEDIPKVFEKFSQIDSTLARQHEGTGLGLPIARSLIEFHGGTLKLESVYGEGTIVSLWLPPDRLMGRTIENPMKASLAPPESYSKAL
jgi:PAS domain S-box-containing protein